MKHIVYRMNEEASNGCPYNITKTFDGETFKQYDEQTFENGGVKAIIPKPHIVICNSDGAQVNVIQGQFVEDFESEREARIHAGRLNDINQLMES